MQIRMGPEVEGAMNEEQNGKVRPHGRTLSDFAPLTTGEQRLLEACRQGVQCRLTEVREVSGILRNLLADLPLVEAIKSAAFSGTKGRELERWQGRNGEVLAEVVSGFTTFAQTFRRARGDAPDSDEKHRLFLSFAEKFKAEVDGWRGVSTTIEATRVRGTFLRFLMLGGDNENPVHEFGIRLSGANIVGDTNANGPLVNLTGSEIPFAVRIEGCRVDGALCFDGARTRIIDLSGTRVANLSLRSAEVRGDLLLKKGFVCEGTVQVAGAQISGNLDCEGGAFVNPSETTIVGDSAKIGGSVLLGKGCVSLGQVSLANTRISGQLTMYGGFFGLSEYAGQAGMPERVHARRRLKFALDFKNLAVGQLFFGPIFPVSAEPATVIGSVNLVAARVENFIFDPESLPRKSVQLANGEIADCTITLDGFRYEHLGVPAGNDVILAMLDLFQQQPSRHLNEDFRPQPYEQLTKTLIEMGRERDAKTIAQSKATGLRWQEWLLLKSDLRTNLQRPKFPFVGRMTERRAVRETAGWLAWPVTAAVAVLTASFGGFALAVKWLVFNGFLGAGHRHVPTYTAFALLWLVCGWVYHEASRTPGAFVPVDKSFSQQERSRTACGGSKEAGVVHWTKCSGDKIPELTLFRPYIYSLDLMLQFGPLGQKRAWEPVSNSPLAVDLEVPFYGPLKLGPGALWWITLLQSVLSIALYILIAKMLSTQIREK